MLKTIENCIMGNNKLLRIKFKPSLKIIVMCFIFIANFSNGQDLKMKFYNKTGFDLDSLSINNTFIGHISKDSVTNYISFDSFVFDSGMADGNLVAIINNKIFATPTTPKTKRCGTEMKVIKEGTYSCDIEIKKWDAGIHEIETIMLYPHQ